VVRQGSRRASEDVYSFSIRNKDFPKPGRDPELEEAWIAGSVALCCADADTFNRLTDADYISIVSNDQTWRIVSTNQERVGRALLDRYESGGYTVGDKDEAIRSGLETVRKGLMAGASAIGWSAPLDPAERAILLAVIRHLQTQVALQQLTMEIYNDAMALSAQAANFGDEMSPGAKAFLSDPRLVEEHLLPTAMRKVAITESMLEEHTPFNHEDFPGEAIAALDKWSEVLGVMLARARLQLTCINDWLKNLSPVTYERMTSLDQAEFESSGQAINELNGLVRRVGLDRDAWFVVNWGAFNSVRARMGLSPLTRTDFNARMLQGQAGGRARFFSP
jgi:hypothetical protein